ncbi:hypothetical protein BLS_006860 [Venturia inaequalis]|uniref:Uncharacterized protein n=1 Tax=Venturia inaequalis TaxID=5025 RepID=A0A8H3ZDW7_VENIN|nr:hypothetical protein BLS_006860 [Venturia inaequalis]KAE9989144.1 hypothetical protein EG328_000076 [Venturia inaequalis]KAE9989727.1 hypothetical protein EG327_002322 [Venturia inaequalis]
MHFSTSLILTSITTVLASHSDNTVPSNIGDQASSMAMSAASSWITGYSLSASSIYPVTGLTVTTKVNGKDDMTTTSVGTYTMAHESGDMNSTVSGVSKTSTMAPLVTSGSTTATVSLSTKASLTDTTTGTAAAQVTTNAAANNAWSAAAGLAAIAGLVIA